MCGGGSDKAQKQAQQQEAEQQAQIKQGIAAINALYADPSRQNQYSELEKSTTDYYTTQLNDQQTIANRKLKFALARAGLGGGSQQAAEGEQLGKQYQLGLTEAAQKGQSAAAALRGQDEQTKQSLIAMVEGGLDATTAQSEAASALRANLAGGSADATAGSLGDLFGDVNQIYSNSLDAKAARQGQKYGYGTIYGSPIYGANPGGQGYGY